MDSNDRILSIRQHLWLLFQDRIASGLRIETEGRVKNLTRPMWNIRQTNHRQEDLGKIGYRDIDLWSIAYSAADGRQDATQALQAFQDSLSTGGKNRIGRILGWRFNWQYPQPVVTPYFDATGTLFGQHSVRVSGIDLCGNESAASDPVLVTLGANNALSIRILRQPFQGTMFRSYNVYVDGHLEANVLHPLKDVPLYPRTEITSLTGVGVGYKVPSNSVAIRWKFIRVDTYADYIREDEVNDRVFNGFVTLQTSTYQEREMNQPEAMMFVNAQQTVAAAQAVEETIVQHYIATPLNPVRISNY